MGDAEEAVVVAQPCEVTVVVSLECGYVVDEVTSVTAIDSVEEAVVVDSPECVFVQ